MSQITTDAIEQDQANMKEMLPPQPFIPEPEAPIDPAECRSRLLEHIDHFQNHIDSRLNTIEVQVSGMHSSSLYEFPKLKL